MEKYLANSVDAYMSNSPKEVQDDLRKIWSAIWDVAPDATERTDYFNLPGYSYEGYDYNGMFAWFSYKKLNVRLHVRPPAIEKYKKELIGCVITKGIVTFPEGKKIPITLVKKLIKASIKAMKDKS